MVLQCHRRAENGVDVVFPVNVVAYHPGFGTFATGGGDGVVNIWDGNNKKRLLQVGSEAVTSVMGQGYGVCILWLAALTCSAVCVKQSLVLARPSAHHAIAVQLRGSTDVVLSAALRTMQISSYPTSIASLAFSPQGNMLAVASSYMFEHGQRQAPADEIYIRPVQEGEVKPKPRKTAAPQ